ncbi:hypothetical protein [Myxococcus fulvus]|uniref:hypothetical protein n=1 Tax=Myxococcus fulvus TaxID=33 RepID=UPI0020BF435B|nr:hypothetical protein [Myxococcus fulvus]
MLDACVLFRLDKCEALPRLKGLAPLHVAASVHAELSKDGPRLRKLLTELRMTKHPVVPGSREWDELARIRGGLFSNQDLGEAESLAVVLVAAQKQRFLPLATFDGGAARTANRLGVPVLDFLSLHGRRDFRLEGPREGLPEAQGFDDTTKVVSTTSPGTPARPRAPARR